MAQKSIQANFIKVLEKALNEKFTGSIVFMGPSGGVVRIVFINGAIKHVDSTWGYGINEIEKLKIWGAGTCLIKELTHKDKEQFSKLLDLEYKTTAKKEKTEEPSKITKVQSRTTKLLPYRILDGGYLTLEEILDEIVNSEMSGFIRIKPSDNVILIYKGRIVSSYSDFPPSNQLANYQVLNEILNPSNHISIYSLDKELALSIITLFLNKVYFSGIDGGTISLEEIFEDNRVSSFNGIIWIDGTIRILIDFENGEIKNILKIDEILRSIEMPKSMDLKFAKIYKLGKLPEGEIIKNSIKIINESEFQEFLKKWIELNEFFVSKIGKKVIQRTFEKLLKNQDFSKFFYAKDGILMPISSGVNPYILLECLIEISSSTIKEIRTFVGGDFLEKKLKSFYQSEKKFIDSLGLDEVLKKFWSI
jgi:hypothetical protein